MNLKYVSFTGADDLINPLELHEIQSKYPFVEWAILMFPEREGLSRNPSPLWRELFYKTPLTNKALHLCGSAINRLANEDLFLMKELENFQRVQINLKPHWASIDLIENLVRVVEKNSDIEFITQYNEANKSFFPYWDNVKNHVYLFDASLGKGVVPSGWEAPIGEKIFGYAGGLGPENIVKNFNDIKSLNHGRFFWLDMESGVRTNDKFSLSKVMEVLENLNDNI